MLDKSSLKNNFYQIIYDILMGTGFSFALSVSLISASLFTPSPWITLLYCVISNTILRIITFNKYTTGFVLVVGAVAVGVVIVSLYRNGFESQWYLNLKELTANLVGYVRRVTPFDQQYDDLLSSATPILMSLGIGLILRLNIGFYIVVVAGFFVIGIPAYFKWGSSRFAIMIFLATFVAALYGRFATLAVEGHGKNKRKATWKFKLSLIPLSLVIFTVAWILPKPDYRTVNIVGTLIRQGGDRVAKEMTFAAQDHPLGGPNVQSNTPVMLVTSTEPVYLSGLVYDTYSTNRWGLSDTGSGELFDRTEDILTYHFYSYSETQYQNDILKTFQEAEKTVKVELVGSPTKMIFTPAFARTIAINFQDPIFYNLAGEVWTEKSAKRGTAYTQTYYSYNRENVEFQDFLRGVSFGWKVYPEDMNRYLYYPESLPKRVIEKTKEITQGYDNNYDKLRSLEEYFSEFSYTLNPEHLPMRADFIDDFLFNGQEGYCVHFASSMALMARTIGIPTRYVEGFVMPPQRNDDGKFLVTGKQAHAWVEACFDGLGWIRFDPTPASSQRIFDTSMLQVVGEQETPILEDPLEDIKPLEEAIPIDEKENKNIPFFLKFLLIFALLGILIFASVKYLVYRVDERENKRRNLPAKEGTIQYFKDIFAIARHLGEPLKPKETMSGYLLRMEDSKLPEEIKEVLRESIPIFIKATYSISEIKVEEKKQMEDSCYKAENFMKNSEDNIVSYFLSKYVFRKY